MPDTPDFSILHASVRLPVGWRVAHDEWKAKCDDWSKVEYILAIDNADSKNWPDLDDVPNGVRIKVNTRRHTSVDAFNLAARKSSGKLLIQTADDWFPCDHWDTELRKILHDDFNKEAVIDVDSQHFTGQIIICPMMTRSYYERPDRGACGGEFFYPEYLSMGADDDLTEYAKRDGVIITAYHLHFQHRHPWTGNHEFDTHGAYAHNQRLESWATKDRVLPRRKADNFLK